MKKIASRTVKGYKYQKENQFLDITTFDGIVYRYFDVPQIVVTEFEQSEAPGLFYLDYIRPVFRRLVKTYDHSVM